MRIGRNNVKVRRQQVQMFGSRDAVDVDVKVDACCLRCLPEVPVSASRLLLLTMMLA